MARQVRGGSGIGGDDMMIIKTQRSDPLRRENFNTQMIIVSVDLSSDDESSYRIDWNQFLIFRSRSSLLTEDAEYILSKMS